MRGTKEACFSSKRGDWATPNYIFDPLNEEFKFDVDVCADSENKKCPDYIDEKLDGLRQEWSDWGRTTWCNPPYSDSTKWIRKAIAQQAKGVTTVMLLPSRTDTKAFHTYIYKKEGVEIRFIEGRIRFVGAGASAPFPSMVVIFHGKPQGPPKPLKDNLFQARSMLSYAAD